MKHRHVVDILRTVWVTFGIFVAGATVLGASSRFINPSVWVFPAFLGMLFPALIIATMFVCGVNLLICRRAAWVQIVALLLSVNALADFCPLNYPRTSPDDVPADRKITVLTYNTFGFHDIENIYPGGTNRTISTIISSDADVVALQEGSPGFVNDQLHITRAQIDTLNAVYPYYVGTDNGLGAIRSRTPLQHITTPQPDDPYASWIMAETTVRGVKMLIVSTHLQSLGLTDEDKQIYRELTNGEADDQLMPGYKDIYDKLATAFRHRASQAAMLASQLDSLGYSNVIVCGDFNDISGCYAQRRISRGKMHSVFSTVGNGPMFTYNRNRFYFNIDHILYQGNLRPLSLERGNIPSSDHYPLTATFEITGSKR